MKVTLRLEDNAKRMLGYLTEWEYPIPWTAEELTASVCLRAEHRGETIAYVWLAPLEIEAGVWSLHIIVRKDFRGRWFSWENWYKFKVVLELLSVSTLMIETYADATRRLAKMLGASEVSENITYLDLEANKDG